MPGERGSLGRARGLSSLGRGFRHGGFAAMRTRILSVSITLAFTAALAVSTIAPQASAQVALRNLVLEAHLDDYSLPGDWGYSACWGYVHPDGREYAVIGTHFGTAIYNVTHPDSVHSVGFIPGLAS